MINTITMDVPLFVRLLEYAREDAKTDMDLHVVAEKCLKKMEKKQVLAMRDYRFLIPKK